jgi:hypothetical protein
MSGEPVVLRTFANETEAELARAILESEGIPSLVHSAGAAGMLLFVQGVQLVVRREDAEAAHEALARQDEERAD